MKILTLNLHCFAEKDIVKNQKNIVNAILEEDVDVILLQEVAQSKTGKIVFDDVKEDNYGYKLKQDLAIAGVNYYYHYKFGNQAFGLYDEGLAILSKTKLTNKNHFFISKTIDYNNWNTRIIVSAKTMIEDEEIVFTSAHLGWSDGVEVFEDQVDILMDNLNSNEVNIIGGDYNISPGSKEYNHFVSKGYIDLFFNNEKEYYNIPTHISDIDQKDGSSRIDYVMSNKDVEVKSRKILFTNNLVSDHYGILIEIGSVKK
jgi:maltose 6'-phosphate phosphatase